MMDLFDRDGASKLCRRCSFPLTASGVVERVYTDFAIFELVSEGVIVRELVTGLSHQELQRHLPVEIH
jgi:3-oxoadipate CoA-transferase beta subunit